MSAKGTTSYLLYARHDGSKWRDKRDVAVLSTCHREWFPFSHLVLGQKMKPKAILTYNDKMGGVYLSDQQLTSYPCNANGIRSGITNSSDIFSIKSRSTPTH